jgi:hypothetical protein
MCAKNDRFPGSHAIIARAPARKIAIIDGISVHNLRKSGQKAMAKLRATNAAKKRSSATKKIGSVQRLVVG